MNFGQIWQIIRARIWLILFTLTVTVGTTAVITLLMTPNYTAETSLVVDFRSNDPVGQTSLPTQLSASYMATQIDILKSQRVAMKVVSSLGLDQDPTIRDSYMAATQGKGSMVAWLSDSLVKNLEVVPSRDSRVIVLRYTADNPTFAANTANAYARAYIDTSLELSVEPARQTTAWLNEQLKTMRGKVEEAQSKVTSYQQKHGIVATDQRLDAENTRMMTLTNQLAVAQAEARDAESKIRQLTQLERSGSLDTFPEIQMSSFIQGIKAELVKQRAKLSEMSRQMGENHPQIQRAKEEISSLEQKLHDEVQKVASSIRNSAQLAIERERSLQQSMNEQKSRMLGMQRQSEELTVLAPEKDSAQRAYDAVMQRFSQISLESEVNQSNVVVLNEAVEPAEPSSPKFLQNMILSVLLGVMLGLGLAFMFEMTDRRVRSSQDLLEGAGVPVIGVLTKGVA